MGKTLKRLYRRLATLSPETKQIIIGVGLIDPLPEPRHRTFQVNDRLALMNDGKAVAKDMWVAVKRAKRERDRANVA
jgi:hypothetical protein